MSILFNYSFYIVAIGTVLLGIVSSLVGSLNVYKGQGLIGDAMGHSSFAGIVLAYMLFSTRSPVTLLLGTVIMCAIAYFLVFFSGKNSKIDLNANLAIYLSGFFGLGLVLKSYIQGNPNFANASQAGLENYIFGQAAYMLKIDVYLVAIVSVICVSIILLLYKEYKTFLFDPEFSKIIKLPINILEYLLLIMTILVIGVGIKSVGAILISSFLIMPNVCASQWTNKFSHVLIIGAIFSSVSAFIGTYLSTIIDDLATGPTIILVLGIFSLISFLFGKKGLIKKRGKK